MYDIAVIGLGPGGATFARLLSGSFKTIVLDRKNEIPSQGFTKPCGGLLALDAQKALSRFHLTLPKDVLVDPQIFAVRTMDTKQDLLRHYQRFYINLDRGRFDAWLISLIPPEVEIVPRAVCTDVSRVEGGFCVTFLKGGEKHKIFARFVVGADGANSLVRKHLFPKSEPLRYLSIQQWFVEQNASPFYSCVFDSDITDSYCWSVSKDGYFILGGAFLKKGAKEKLELLKVRLKGRGIVFGEPVKTEACLVSMPRGPGDFETGKDGAFLLGEAAGFISPSSLEGISYALNSAHILADVLNARGKAPNREYARKTRRICLKLLLKRLKSPFMYHPFLRKCVMKSGLLSIRVAEEINR